MSKDVLIAGGVVVVCVALVVVALTATGKKKPADEPLPPIGSTYDSAPLTPPSSNPYSTPAPPSFDNGGSLGGSGSFSGSGSLGGSGSSGSGSLGGAADPLGAGPSPLAPTPVGPAPMDNGGGLGPAPMAQNDLLGPNPGPTPMGGSLPPVGGVEPAAAPATKGGGTHVVAKGETLGDISAQAYGSSKHWRKIVEANPGLDPARLKIGQSLTIPAIEGSSSAGGAAAGGADTYTVKAGESYYTIAKKVLGSASRWRELERLNNVPAESLKAGTVLKVPAKESAGGAGPAAAGGGKTHIVGKGETLGDISKQYFGTTTKWKKIVEANPGLRPEALKVGQQIAIPEGGVEAAAGGAPEAAGGYTVKAGDTLETIAGKELGSKSAWKKIVEANPGLKPSALRVGQKIVIPGAPAAAPVAAPAAGGLDAAPMGGGPAPATAPVGPPPKPVDDFKNDPFYSPYDALPPAPAPAPAGPGRSPAAPAGSSSFG